MAKYIYFPVILQEVFEMQIDLFTFIFAVVFIGSSITLAWYCYQCGKKIGNDQVINYLASRKIITFDDDGNIIPIKSK